MLRQLATFVVVLVAFATNASSQNTWPHAWGGSADDSATAIARDTAGNIYVAGSTQSFGAGGSDALLLKYDAAGHLLWSKTWGGGATDYATAVAVDSAGGVYVTGGTDSFGAGWRDVFLLKFDGSGNLLWNKTWGGGSYDVGHDIAFDSAGNILIAAETYSYRANTAGSSAAVLKFTPGGDLIWSQIWASIISASFGYEGGYSLDVDANGNIFLSGITWDYTVYPRHDSIFIVKYDASGNLIWNRNWAGPSEDEAWGTKTVRADKNGNIYVAGRMANQCLSQDFSTCNFGVLLLKVDTNGNYVWSRTWFSATGFTTANSFDIDGGGNLVIAGHYVPTDTALLLRFDPSGNLLSNLTWSGGPGAAGGAVLVDPLGNIFVAGNASNNVGTWQGTQGVVGTESGTLSAPTSSVGSPSVTLGSPSATLTSPSGVIDTGGGGQDVFVSMIPTFSGPPPASPNNGPAGGTSNPQGQTSEPISTGNGNYYYQHSDFVIPGRGIPLLFQRSYNTLDNYSGPLGTNWTHSYNLILTQPSSSTVNIRWGDGHGEAFTLTGTTYVPQPGVFSAFVANGDGTFTLTQKSQTKYNFSPTGKLISIQDKNGNTIALSYDGSGNLVQITDTVGRALTLAYDASNRITQITDPISRSVTFQYDANNNLIQATDPAGGITKYAYDSNHRVTSIIQPNGQTLLQNTYDASGRVISQSGGRGFATTLAYDTPAPRQTTITDARGNKTIHTYDSSLRIVSITDSLGGTTSFSYDANNDRTSVTNQNGKTTNFSYDTQGNVTGIADPLSNTVAFTYDSINDLLTATNAKGKTTTFAYDANENLKTIQDALSNTTNFSYDSFGELSSKTDARGNSTAFTYDSSGNLTRITDPLGHSTTLAYDGIGRLTSITDPNGHAAAATYDALSRLTKITDPLSNVTQFAYDPVGNLLKITDANGKATSYAYDATNNLVSVTDALGHLTQYAYDANNNRGTFKNAKGNVTAYAYDALNRLATITDPLSFVTSYGYDAMGNVLAVTDAKGQTNRFTYDALNRLLGIAYADGKSVAYSYDANGNRATMADSHGTTTYGYDALDRLVSVTHPGNKVVQYAYDAVGNRKSLTYPDGKVATYAYDQANRLSQVTDWLAHITSYAYDPGSNLSTTSYPNGTSIAFSYDAANRLTRVINSAFAKPLLNLAYTLDAVGNRTGFSVDGIPTAFGYDSLNELVSAQLGPLKSSWAYDPVGNRTQRGLPLLGTTKYTYDAADRLLTAGSATYTYDANGNETSLRTNATAKPIIFQYDAANRLTSVSGSLKNSAFAYDGDGNRVSQSVGTGTYNYINDVATALPVVLQESGPDGNITYGYGLGLIEESSSTFNYFYHYDGLGSVIALTDALGKPQAVYAYDPWGNPLLSVTDHVGTKNKFRFTGEALDPGTGLYYLRARYYDASAARFISRDPLRGGVKLPLTMNRFAYGLNNPNRYVDPTGLSALSWLSSLAGNVFGTTNLSSQAQPAVDIAKIHSQCYETLNCDPGQVEQQFRSSVVRLGWSTWLWGAEQTVTSYFSSTGNEFIELAGEVGSTLKDIIDIGKAAFAPIPTAQGASSSTTQQPTSTTPAEGNSK